MASHTFFVSELFTKIKGSGVVNLPEDQHTATLPSNKHQDVVLDHGSL